MIEGTSLISQSKVVLIRGHDLCEVKTISLKLHWLDVLLQNVAGKIEQTKQACHAINRDAQACSMKRGSLRIAILRNSYLS